MRMGFVKRVAIAVVGTMTVMAGAAAADTSPNDWHGSGWTATASPEVAAGTVQRLHDQLKSTYEAGDVAGVKANVRELDGVLAALVTRSDEWATRAEVRDNSSTAKDKNDQLSTALASIPDGTAKGLPGLDLLSGVTALLTSLLGTLLDLVTSLLGGLPLPVPLPPLPVPPIPVVPVPAP
jgi:opacity protein-like surface antigen